VHEVDDHPVVAVFALSIYVRDLLRDILPSDSNGIVVVFENTCKQTFTYEFKGPDVVYLGSDDLHDPAYDGFELSSRLLDLRRDFSSRDWSYTGTPLSEEGCQYSLHVYPSARMEAHFATTNPAMLAVAAVLIFILTSGMWCADCSNETKVVTVLIARFWFSVHRRLYGVRQVR